MENAECHLSPEKVAICADAINNGTYNKLPDHLLNQLQECDICAHEVIDVAEIAFGL